MTEKKSTRPTSNFLDNNSKTEDKIKSTRPQSNIDSNLTVSNENLSFDGMNLTVRVSDEDSINSHKNKK